MIILGGEDFISKGAYRVVYIHPNDPNKVIKINHTDGGNEREIESYNKADDNLKKFLPKFYGVVKTNLGDGYVFERIINYDNRTSLKLFDHLSLNKNDANTFKDEIIKQITNIYNIFANNYIFSTSFGIENIVLQKKSENEIKLYIIDTKIHKHKEFIPITKIPFFLKMKRKRRGKRIISQIRTKMDLLSVLLVIYIYIYIKCYKNIIQIILFFQKSFYKIKSGFMKNILYSFSIKDKRLYELETIIIYNNLLIGSSWYRDVYLDPKYHKNV